MAKFLKWAAIFLAAFLLLLIGVAVALQHWVRTDDFRARVEQQASAALGVPLRLGRLSVDLWPLPAVAADDVQLLTRPPLTIARVEARPVWSGLLEKRLEIATLVVRKAVLPQAGITALGAAVQKKDKAAPRPAAPVPQEQGPSIVAFPQRAVLDDITWIDEKGQRMTVRAEADLGGDGMLERASFRIVQGRFAGTQGAVERKGEEWPLRVEIGGGRIVGKLHLTSGRAPGMKLLQGQLNTDNVELAALTAPSKVLSGKLQAQTSLRSEFREFGRLADALNTQTRFTVRDALVDGLDLQKAVQTVGLSRGGTTRLDTLAGQVTTQGKAVHLANLVASSGSLSASGNVSITPAKALSGRVNVDLASTRGALGVPLVVGGTIDAPSVMLTRGALVGAAVGTLIVPGAGTAAGATAGDRIGESLRGLFGK
ncbi:AsmA family protein [Ramlibacter alkalitolerans]|uniref:AsmA family protein n=1 Tax=Ramlibacter alkalitolerans TaxID=2039631 RepID=A0ABS1JQ49_9BURK|nr:AsmA family protein [Ramlibacter alkalitolerans]MBL0425670.1 AsmA family protein [Ramlibacter alkalitolerans]